MSAANVDPPGLNRRRSRWRFSLAGLMVAILGIAAGLAVTRLDGVRWFDGLLAAFAIWFAIGCWNKAAALFRASSLERDAHASLKAVGNLAAPPVVLLGIGLLIASEARAPALRFDEFHFSLAIRALCLDICVLAILLSVPEPTQVNPSQRGVWHGMKTAVSCLAAIGLTVLFVGNLVLIAMLVHTAIHSVRNVQANRPGGDGFSSHAFDPSDSHWFSAATLAAATLWCGSVVALHCFARTRAAATRRHWLAAIVLVASQASVVFTSYQCFRLLQERISPILTTFIWSQKPLILGWLGLLFAFTAATWVMLRLARQPDAWAAAAKNAADQQPRFVHEWLIVLVLPIAWWVADFSQTFRLVGTSFDMSLELMTELSSLLMLAYCLHWLRLAWRRWKGSADECHPSRDVPIRHLFGVWLGALAVVVTAAPVWACLCFALWIWPDRFPGEEWLLIRP